MTITKLLLTCKVEIDVFPSRTILLPPLSTTRQMILEDRWSWKPLRWSWEPPEMIRKPPQMILEASSDDPGSLFRWSLKAPFSHNSVRFTQKSSPKVLESLFILGGLLWRPHRQKQICQSLRWAPHYTRYPPQIWLCRERSCDASTSTQTSV